jgi:hypothetical protein
MCCMGSSSILDLRGLPHALVTNELSIENKISWCSGESSPL